MEVAPADLVGTWVLHRYVVIFADGAETSPYGQTPSGLLIYGPDGHMSVHMADPARPPLGSDTTKASGPAAKAAVATYISYAGTYRLQGDRVMHMVTICSLQEMVGSKLVRRAELSGDTLNLIADEITFDGKPACAALQWRRAAI